MQLGRGKAGGQAANVTGGMPVNANLIAGALKGRKSILVGGQANLHGQEDPMPKRFYEDTAGKKQDKD